MRKFLKLIQENKPGISYIIDIKDTDDNLLGSAAIPGHTNTSFYEEFANYLKNVHEAEVVGVNTERPEIPAEDYEIKSGEAGYDVDKEVAKMAQRAKSGVAGLAGKVLGTKAQKAKKLMKDRENIVVKAFDLFDQDTKNLKQAVQDAAKSPTTP